MLPYSGRTQLTPQPACRADDYFRLEKKLLSKSSILISGEPDLLPRWLGL